MQLPALQARIRGDAHRHYLGRWDNALQSHVPVTILACDRARAVVRERDAVRDYEADEDVRLLRYETLKEHGWSRRKVGTHERPAPGSLPGELGG